MVINKLKYIVGIFAVCCFTFQGFSQNENNSDTKLKFKAAISIAPGLLTENTKTVQLQGYFGIRPKAGKIELRGDAFYFLDSFGDRPRFSMNHQLYMGAFYRFSNKAFQPYVGFQPGIAYSQSSEFGTLDADTELLYYKKSLNPVGSIAGGFDFFAEKLFFLFVETRYIFGKHKSNSHPIFLDELRFSFGLGFHI